MALPTDWTKFLSQVPWQTLAGVVTSGFVAASVISTTTGVLLMPSEKEVKRLASPQTTKVRSSEDFGADQRGLKRADREAIMARNLFQAEEEKLDESEVVEEVSDSSELVESKLPFKLVGTIYGGDPFSGIAMLEHKTKRSVNSLMVGDILMARVTLIEVFRERVVIDNKGRKEYIELEKEEPKTRRRGVGKATPAPSLLLKNRPKLAKDPPPSSYKEEGFERENNEIEMACSYRQRLLGSDFTKVLQDAKASAYMVDGELRGFELTRIREDSIYRKSGLMSGDVITEVNGVPLRNTGQAIKFLNSLRKTNSIEVRLLRQGAPTTITLDIKC